MFWFSSLIDRFNLLALDESDIEEPVPSRLVEKALKKKSTSATLREPPESGAKRTKARTTRSRTPQKTGTARSNESHVVREHAGKPEVKEEQVAKSQRTRKVDATLHVAKRGTPASTKKLNPVTVSAYFDDSAAASPSKKAKQTHADRHDETSSTTIHDDKFSKVLERAAKYLEKPDTGAAPKTEVTKRGSTRGSGASKDTAKKKAGDDGEESSPRATSKKPHKRHSSNEAKISPRTKAKPEKSDASSECTNNFLRNVRSYEMFVLILST
ncbi:unnamed protein product [Soboliphyme baturini]|uniref:Nucleolar and coiled-body phosphoprotein 1 n=1 Tax=Soboliphyme baturini TaxID=241478 RepID=A0A183J4W5_9BILA|nr:unnamed protein product [Soboliphyme baturini]